MALFNGKWEVKSWQELSASVADSSNALEFRPKHRLPYKLQQGAKASKVVGGFFNRESILTAPDYPDGFFIYDTGSGLSYTGLVKANFKSDVQNFLASSSFSSAAKAQLSASFEAVNHPDIIVQVDESGAKSLLPFSPATASWDVPCAFIGDSANGLVTVNNSTNSTNIKLKAAGAFVAGSVKEVEFTLPMETISFTGTFVSRSIKFASFTGSEYTPDQYANSAIYTPHGEAQTTASIIGEIFGSGSFKVHERGLYNHVEYGGFLMALGDDILTGSVTASDGGYEYGGKLEVLHFPSGSVVASASFTNIYATTDTNMSGSSGSAGTLYFVSGSLSATGSSFWDNTFPNGAGYLTNNQNSGSHLFADALLKTPAAEGIYKISGSGTAHQFVSGSLVLFPTSNIQEFPRVPRFSGIRY